MNWNTLISAKRFGLEEFHQERPENRSMNCSICSLVIIIAKIKKLELSESKLLLFRHKNKRT